jgi:NADP-dependent aldehyde dehydrogenase
LHEEVFGPAAVVVVCESEAELLAGASTILGAQAGTIWAAAADTQLAGRVETILMQRVGRIIFNTATTSLEPLASLVHGGPFPASTMASMTATGPDSIYRWTRPVCFQNAPDALLPAELRDGNPLGIERRVAGELTREAVKGKAVKSVAA